MHDAITRGLVIFQENLQEVDRIKGYAISLYYQEDMIMNDSGDLCMWYKGNGVISIVDAQSLQQLRAIEGIAGKHTSKV